MLRLVRMRPYRCHECDRRFFALSRPQGNSGDPYSSPESREVSETPAAGTANLGESTPQEPVKARARAAAAGRD